MLDHEVDDNSENYSLFDALNQDDYDTDNSSYDGDNDDIVECFNCDWSWDISDSSPEDAYLCHKCGHDNLEEEEESNFDDSVFDMDFSEIRGKNFKQSFGKVNRKIESRPKTRRKRRLKRNPTSRTSQPISRKSAPSFRPARPKRKMPIDNNIPVKKGKYNLKGTKRKKISNVIVPNNQKVLIEGASKFILSQRPQDEGIKNIQYYQGKKLKPLVFIIKNDTPTDFNFELFNPSMPLDYLYSTSQNLNDRIIVAGGLTSYTDVLFNLLANPALIINAQLASAGSSVSAQNVQPMFWKNKSIEGVQAISPVNLDLKVDNMQVANDIIYFNVHDAINRAFVPDGMDVIQYKVLAGMSVTICFWYKQTSLKKVFYKEARESKQLM